MQYSAKRCVPRRDFDEEGQLLAPLAVDEPLLRTLWREPSVPERVVRGTAQDGEAKRHGAELVPGEDDRDGAERGQKPALSSSSPPSSSLRADDRSEQ